MKWLVAGRGVFGWMELSLGYLVVILRYLVGENLICSSHELIFQDCLLLMSSQQCVLCLLEPSFGGPDLLLGYMAASPFLVNLFQGNGTIEVTTR